MAFLRRRSSQSRRSPRPHQGSRCPRGWPPFPLSRSTSGQAGWPTKRPRWRCPRRRRNSSICPPRSPSSPSAAASGPDERDWLGTLQAAAYGLAGYDSGAEELIAALRAALPQDMGDDFRLRYALAAVLAIRDTISIPAPPSRWRPPEMRECWEAGYWLRAVSLSAPDEAHRELARG